MKKILVLFIATILVLSLAACGSKPSDTPSDVSESGENIQSQTAPNSSSTSDEENSSSTNGENNFVLDITETDDTMIWKLTDNTYVEITHDGDKVTGYKAYIEFGSAEEAKRNAETLQFYVTMEGSTIKSITSKGNYVVYEYTEEDYLFTDYAAAKEAFDAYNATVGK